MKSKQIVEVALNYFSYYGYKGTTLTKIAESVGIKTPSLYAHFKSKQDIFFACLSYSLENDYNFLKNSLIVNKMETPKQTLYNLLINYDKRVHDNTISMFCLRMLYLPPNYFESQLIEETNKRLENMRKLLDPVFKEAYDRNDLKVEVDEAVEAYLCLFDGLVIELLYTNRESFQYRLEASWHVFSHGLFL